MDKALQAIDRIGACLKLRDTQLGPTCDTQNCCQFRAVLWLLVLGWSSGYSPDTTPV